MFASVVGGVEVIGEGRELRCNCINLLDEWNNGGLLSKAANGELGGADAAGDLLVREAVLLAATEKLGREVGNVASTVDKTINKIAKG